MDIDRFADLLSWVMMNTMNTALIFDQQQKQRPLTSEEIEALQLKTMRCVEVLRDGYLDGLEKGPDSGN